MTIKYQGHIFRDAGGLYVYLIIGFLSTIIFSCKLQPNSGRNAAERDPHKVYRLMLNPAMGSKYTYSIEKETEFELNVDGKKVKNENKSTTEISYTVGRDSAGNILLNMVYDKIHLYSKNGDTEQELDADKGDESGEPVERMLGILKGAHIQAVVSPAGEMLSLNGYDSIKAKLLTGFTTGGGINVKEMAEKQWDDKIKEGLIKSNMEQLFRIFPDSAVHIGDRWKLNSTQKDQVNLSTRSDFLLKDIQDGTAVIHAQGDIASDNGTVQKNGLQVEAKLNGTQQGDFEIELASGMLLNGEMASSISGSMTAAGREIPVTIAIKVKMSGHKD